MLKTAFCGWSARGSNRRFVKPLLVMKLTVFLLTAVFLEVHATGVSQTVSLSAKDMPLTQVFQEIRNQTGLAVMYSEEVMQGTTPVSVEANHLPVEQLLKYILKDQPLEFTRINKTILISRKIASGLVVFSDQQLKYLETMLNAAPPADIHGRVVDSTGNGLAGVNVQVKGSQAVTATNERGEFVLTGVQSGAELEIAYIGYVTQRLRIGDNRQLYVRMLQDVREIDELNIISTGYQAIPRERMTGSFSTVETKRLSTKLQPSLLTALEGQAAGLVVTKDGKVEIRGKSTFLANADPLIVVDGYPISGGLETINIDNVESVTVLKDAVAASIYGARSSNGVIVITTKTSKRDKPQLSYKGSAGVTLRPDLSYLDRTPAADYVDAEIAVYKVNPTTAQTTYDRSAVTSRVTQLLISKDRGLITEAQMNAELDQLRKNDGIDQLQQYVFRPRQTQQHNISLTAGNDRNRTNAAVRYMGNRNNMIGNKDNRVIFDLKNDWKPGRNVTIRMFSNINFSTTTAPVRTADELLSYSSTSTLRPYSMIVDPATGQPQNLPVVRPQLISQYAAINGLKPMDYNPLNDLMLETARGQNLQARLGGSITVNILDGLSAEVGGAWTRGATSSRTIYDAKAYRVRALYNAATSVSNTTKHYVPDGAMVDEYRNINEAYTFRGQVNFSRVFHSKHRISAIAGGEINRDRLDNNVYPTRFGYNDQAGAFSPFNYADYGAGLYSADVQLPGGLIAVNNGSYAFRDNRFVSMYANGSYEYDNRFILSGSARIDQTNFFGTNPKYRYKPNWSIGGTYKLGQEKFFDVPWINKLNIRGSYGINGNISLKQGPYLLVAANGFSPTSGGIVYSISSPPNNDLRWERTQILNLGTDLSFFNKRLNASIDYYNKLSKDLLSPDFVDPTYGYSSIIRNAGSARNTGIELSLSADVVKTRKFNWNASFNGSYNNSKVLKFNYNYLYTTYLTLSSSSYLFGGSGGTSLKTDYPLDAVFSYQFAGLDNTGTPTFYTAGKANKVLGGNLKVQDMVYSGTIRPKYVLNLTNTFSYQRFDFSFMFISQLGGVFRRDTYYGSNYNNKYVAQRWRQPGDEATTIYPKLSNSSSDGWYFPYSDAMIQSANYMKLRDVTLTYTLDNNIWGRTGINNVKVYFQGRNLWTVTANHDHIDPETSAVDDSGSILRTLPLRPEFYIGLSLNF